MKNSMAGTNLPPRKVRSSGCQANQNGFVLGANPFCLSWLDIVNGKCHNAQEILLGEKYENGL